MNRSHPALIIVTNGSLPASGGRYYLPQWEANFYQDVARSARLAIWSDTSHLPSRNLVIEMPLGGNLAVVPLSSPGDNSLSRLASRTTQILRQFQKSEVRRSMFYLYYPGRNSAFVASILRILRVPYVLYIRGEYGSKGLKAYIHSRTIRGAAGCIVTGGYLEQRVQLLNRNVQQVVPMMNVTSADLPRYNTAEATGTFKILFVGQLLASKGLYVYIDVLRTLRLRGWDIKATIIGIGTPDAISDLERQIDRTGSGSLVELVPRASPTEVRAELLASHVFLFPTEYAEGFPRVLYEAMTLGAPVVTTDRGELFGWMLRDGQNALLRPAGNVQEFADAVELLMQDVTLRRNLAAKAKDTMAAFFKSLPASSHADQVVQILSSRRETLS